ncbi:hypothetical protein RJZ90_000624 [Blastomyces dermatitidis]
MQLQNILPIAALLVTIVAGAPSSPGEIYISMATAPPQRSNNFKNIDTRSEANLPVLNMVDKRSDADAATMYVVDKRSDADAATMYVVDKRSDADAATMYVVDKRSDADAATMYVVDKRSDADAATIMSNYRKILKKGNHCRIAAIPSGAVSALRREEFG